MSKARRASFVIIFGEGDQRWSMPDPRQKRVSDANRAARYGELSHSDGLILASVASAFAYLIHDCPTTKLAIEKLRMMRAAVRALPDPDASDR